MKIMAIFWMNFPDIARRIVENPMADFSTEEGEIRIGIRASLPQAGVADIVRI
jgi:hypothetical protein